jgi:hypothetical protein
VGKVGMPFFFASAKWGNHNTIFFGLACGLARQETKCQHRAVLGLIPLRLCKSTCLPPFFPPLMTLSCDDGMWRSYRFKRFSIKCIEASHSQRPAAFQEDAAFPGTLGGHEKSQYEGAVPAQTACGELRCRCDADAHVYDTRARALASDFDSFR